MLERTLGEMSSYGCGEMAQQRLPGLIDVHVHLRDPGDTHKEDVRTGSRAALRGGVTAMADMPNNREPTITLERLEDKVRRADEVALCDVYFHFGTDGQNIEQFVAAAAHPRVLGLKVYFNPTTGNLMVTDPVALDAIFAGWQSSKPILVHAEGDSVAQSVELAQRHRRRLHVCHIAQASEVQVVRDAKAQGLPVTCGVCPHHLYLIDHDRDRRGGEAIMKPPLGSSGDRDALWAALEDRTVDIVETDHAPHTRQEKSGSNPAYGVPGLETALGLLLLAAHERRLTVDDVVRLMHHAPRAIFDIPEQTDTWIEVDPDQPYVIGAAGYETKCGWSPFDGMTAYGPVRNVQLRGRPVLVDGTIVD